MRWFVLLIASFGFAASGLADEVAVRGALERSHKKFVAEADAMVSKYCADCHSPGSASGGVAFDLSLPLEETLAELKTWKKAARMMRSGQMPPSDADQPTKEENDRLIAAIDGFSQSLDQLEPFDPGPSAFRRLSRREYERSIQDLFGIDTEIAAAVGFSKDPQAFGYDSIAAVLEIPPAQMEKYAAAADEMLDRVVNEHSMDVSHQAKVLKFTQLGKMPERPGKNGKLPAAMEQGKGRWILRVRSACEVSLAVPEAGYYRLRLNGYAYNAVHWQNYTADIAVEINGRRANVVSFISKQNDDKSPVRKIESADTLVYLPKGDVSLRLEYLNPVHGPHWSDTRFKYLAVENLSVAGPQPASGAEVDTKAHQHVFFQLPDKNATEVEKRKIAEQIVERFASRAWRRSLGGNEVQRLLSLYDLSQKRGAPFQRSVRPALKAVLLSPRFLFRIEEDADAPVHAVSDEELATRLSFFLWGSPPDEELRTVAAAGRLSNPEELKKQALRMIVDERSERFSESFAAQWLRLEELENALPSEDRFPDFTAEMRHSMRMEVLHFFQNLVKQNLPVTDLIDSDYTFMDRQLSRIYRMGNFPEHGVFKQVKIDSRRRERGGLLGMGGILAMTSHIDRNSPTRRGKWVLDVMFGDPPPPPPNDVEQIDSDGDKNGARTFRELLAIHADESSTCAGCHKKMDPLGFALENFDPVGRWQSTRDGAAIDSTGRLPGGREVKGVVELREYLMSEKDRFAENLVEQLLIYALGRDLNYYDRPTVSRIVKRAKDNGYRMQELLVGVVESYPFRMRRRSDAAATLARATAALKP